MTLARKTAVPAWHPEAESFRPVPVHAWLVHHPDGLVLVDTGVGFGSDAIDRLYRHDVVPLREALAGLRVDPAEIVAVVVTHLHFDHCGQLNALPAPVYVQAREHRESLKPLYSVPAWTTIPERRLRLVDGDEHVAEGLRLITTPGHTPGHQSVVVEGAGKRVVLAGQCAYRAGEVMTGLPRATNLHDDSLAAVARESLARIRALRPVEVHLSHDDEIVVLQ